MVIIGGVFFMEMGSVILQVGYFKYTGGKRIFRVSPEAVTAACAMAAVQGEIQCKLWPRDESERQFALDEGLDLDQVLTNRDLVNSDNTFFAATGVTSGDLLEGVEFRGNTVRTHSLVMRSKTATVRFVDAVHRLDQLNKLGAEY